MRCGEHGNIARTGPAAVSFCMLRLIGRYLRVRQTGSNDRDGSHKQSIYLWRFCTTSSLRHQPKPDKSRSTN